jgi:glucokinase
VLLVGDIGGTHARLALANPNGRVVQRRTFGSREFPSLEAVILEFLGSIRPKPKVASAAFGVAGPVVSGRVVATNLPWVVDSRIIARKIGIKQVTLLNDLVALALGAIKVPRAKLRFLSETAEPPKKRGHNLAVIAAGTGLGEAMLIWDGEGFVPSATEGGHADFAARDDLEVELLQFLRGRFGRVSYERILSGNGLGNLYDFFTQGKRLEDTRENSEAIATSPDRNATISELGLSGRSEAASRAVHLFAQIYGAEAGNLALKALSLGGVYVCGNIAARLLPILEGGGFRRAFLEKGRFGSVMEKIPVAVVLDGDVGLVGAVGTALASARSR